MSEKVPKAGAFEKQWVVLRWTNGTTTIVPDYGGYAWGSARYDVAGYFKTKKEALARVAELRAEADQLEKLYGDPAPDETVASSPLVREFIDKLKNRGT